MLYPFTGSIQQYSERVELRQEGDRCRPVKCPQCESKQPLICHGFYARTVEDRATGFVIRVRRYLCVACRRTVSLLPEFVLPYMRFTIVTIGLFLTSRLLKGQTLNAAAEIARQASMPYQRGQQWVDRFRRHAEALSLSLTRRCRGSLQRPVHSVPRPGFRRGTAGGAHGRSAVHDNLLPA
jgi:transposase-like protein